MKKLLKPLLIGLVALLLPLGGAVGMLAMLGKLNRGGLSEVPGVRRLFPPAPVDEAAAEAEDEADADTVADAPPALTLDPAIAAALEAGALDLEEVIALAADLREARTAYERKSAKLETDRDSIQEQRKDLAYRRRAVEELLARARGELDAVTRAKRELRDGLTVLTDSERTNLAKLAKIFESMRPRAAAERMARLDDPRVALLLSLMRPRTAAKIFEGLPPDRVPAVTTRYTKLIEHKRLPRVAVFQGQDEASDGDAAAPPAPDSGT